MIRTGPTPLRLLIVDDDLDAVQMTKDCLQQKQLQFTVSEVYDGKMLLDYLRSDTKNLPQLILLDIKMPEKGGLEALEEIKKDEVLRKIPVIIFSTSEAEQDIEKAYALGASCFVSKPKSFAEWCDKIDKIGRFWSQYVRVPE